MKKEYIAWLIVRAVPAALAVILGLLLVLELLGVLPPDAVRVCREALAVALKP